MKKFALSALVCLLSSGGMFGQGYYDDDIYYDASKAKAEKKEAVKKQVATATYSGYSSGDYAASEYQVYNNDASVDVDAYNRRGMFARQDTVATDTTANNNVVFEYTERI